MVAFREEFPANFFPWKRLEARGVRVEWLSIDDPLDRVDQACRGARLLAISFVQYLGGQRADLEAIGEICHRHGCLFLVDAIQGLGAFPLDVRQAHIHALAADGHKWLLGPEGCGILYIQKDLQDSIEPVEFGWTNVAHYNDYASRDMTLRPDAGRYECGTLNTIGCYGLRAAIEFLLEVGVDRIAPAVQALGDQMAEGVVRKGYEVLAQADPGQRRRHRELPQGGPRQPNGRAPAEGAGNRGRPPPGLGARLPAFLHQPRGHRPHDRSAALKILTPRRKGAKKTRSIWKTVDDPRDSVLD